mgnify:CR=1 FL=1
MLKVNSNYLKLQKSYLFSEIAAKVKGYRNANPKQEVISLGIGDVTRPLSPGVLRALHQAVEEMGNERSFRGYGPELGYDFLREKICRYDFAQRHCRIDPDEIFISDGAKSDCGNIQEIFSTDCVIAVCDPVYPVYVDSNVMSGRTGDFDPTTSQWSNVIYMPCHSSNDFVPDLPERVPDLIYICSPNNLYGCDVR